MSSIDVKSLRSGKGYFHYKDIVQALRDKGHNISIQAYINKEKGLSPFTAVEIKLLAEILEITLEKAYEVFL